MNKIALAVQFLILLSLILLIILLLKYIDNDKYEYIANNKKIEYIVSQIEALNDKFDNGITITIE